MGEAGWLRTARVVEALLAGACGAVIVGLTADFENGVPALLLGLVTFIAVRICSAPVVEAVSQQLFERVLRRGDVAAARRLLAMWHRRTRWGGDAERRAADVRSVRVSVMEGAWDALHTLIERLDSATACDPHVRAARARLHAYRSGATGERAPRPPPDPSARLVCLRLLQWIAALAVGVVAFNITTRSLSAAGGGAVAVLALMTTWFASHVAAMLWLVRAYARAAARADVGGVLAAASLARAAGHSPEDSALMEFTAHAESADWQQAHDLLTSIDPDRVRPIARAVYVNNLAWTHLQLGDARRALALAEPALATLSTGDRAEPALRDTVEKARQALSSGDR